MSSFVLSVDVMGGDDAPGVVLDALKHFAKCQPDIVFDLHGQQDVLTNAIKAAGLTERCHITHHDDIVTMEDKPSTALRQAKTTSMWGAIRAVKTGRAEAVVSAGNTGALMAFAMRGLGRMEGVYRPAMAVCWPTLTGHCIVLDVGANLDANAEQLVTCAIMGEAYARALTGKARPRVGLLNIGIEDGKGCDTLNLAGDRLQQSWTDIDFCGYVEGNDISMGAADVVVTDGFTGNVALKTAEGTARLVANYVRQAMTANTISKIGALLAKSGLERLKARMDPSNINGGLLLGLNGVVVKSHGSADAKGYAAALKLAADLAQSNYMQEVATKLRAIKTK